MEKSIGNTLGDEVFAEDQLETTQSQDNPEEANMEKARIEQKHPESDSDDESTNLEEFPEYIDVDMDLIDTYLRCQICLDKENKLSNTYKAYCAVKDTTSIMRKTRVIKDCGHRFCGECIDKALRLGKKECPLCRVHCASHRATIEDRNFDALIANFLPYMDQEDSELHEEDKLRNQQSQASTSGITRKRSNRKRNVKKDP